MFARFSDFTAGIELELELVLSRWLWERGEKGGASLQKRAVGIVGREVVFKDLRGSPIVDEPLRLKFQTAWYSNYLWTLSRGGAHPFNLADHQNKDFVTRTLRSTRSRTSSQTEGLARVFATRWKTTALSDRGV
jgi:hypothetical protein